MNFLESLRSTLRPNQLLLNEPMRAHTTMRVGGPADIAIKPDSPDQLLTALALAREHAVSALVIGNGSNLLVRDKGIRGLVILTQGLNAVRSQGNTLHAQAGALLPALASEALKSGLTGLEFAAGIPGSVGGAIAMNAGAYGGCIADALVRARVLMDGEDRWFTKDELTLSYRHSRVLDRGGIVLEAEFQLASGDPTEIKARMDDLSAQRRAKQPLELPSSGSTFKRPPGHFAGALIEQAGLKGFAVGGAQVSPKHAGFVVNASGASARDVLALIEQVQQKVLAQSGVLLACEVRIVGEE